VKFATTSARFVLSGGKAYWLWIGLLLTLIVWGGLAYVDQFRAGLIVTNMRDQVSWAFYIGNFTFLVGVAAAAVILVLPAYVYHWGPIKEVAILGEILAISAIVMCLLFVAVDMGRPDRAWHLVPGLGRMNFPSSVLAWDVLVLNLYLVLNLVIVTHILYRGMQGRPYNQRLVVPLVLFSVPSASTPSRRSSTPVCRRVRTGMPRSWPHAFYARPSVRGRRSCSFSSRSSSAPPRLRSRTPRSGRWPN
jgi:molybdopterin-containing oxidoreductase family membrane subunit